MYRIKLSDDAVRDFDEYIHHIRAVYHAPITATKHYAGLSKCIDSLKYFPERHPLQTSNFFLRYGPNVRRMNYKKMAIIYSVHGDIVYIHRIMPANLITS